MKTGEGDMKRGRETGPCSFFFLFLPLRQKRKMEKKNVCSRNPKQKRIEFTKKKELLRYKNMFKQKNKTKLKVELDCYHLSACVMWGEKIIA